MKITARSASLPDRSAIRRRPRQDHGEGGRIPLVLVLAVLGLLVLLPAGCLAMKTLERTAPALTIRSSAQAIGQGGVRITIEADEPKYGIKDLRASFVQEGAEIPLGEVTHPRNPWWRFWRRDVRKSALLEVEVGRGRIPALKEGQATIRAEATNDSWAGFGAGRTATAESVLPVSLSPPRVEILSAQHYINQGGSECVLYRVSDTAVTSGVRVGDYFFRGYPVPGGGTADRFAIFAFPWNVPASAVPMVVAADAAGNEAKATFTYKLFPKEFRRERVELTESFLQRVVPAILSQSPAITSQGDLVKDFLQINGPLRRANAAALVELAVRSKSDRLWGEPFVQLGNSKVEASFADHRSYVYQDRVIDEQDHLGFDLAVTAQAPVDAANDGVVMLASWFGIYGNTVVLDHGFGLLTLYSHLSSIEVKPGDAVKRGQLIGRSGATGLAGGDHLHFGVLVQGIPVNPVEWWDAHWIRDRIESKLGPKG